MSQRPTKNERRQQAREATRLAREAAAKREKRNKILLQGGIALGVVTVLAVIALAITNSLRPAGPAAFPTNMASGGVVFGKDLKVVSTPKLKDGADFKPTALPKDGERPVHVRVFVDFMCPACGQFEKAYGSMLEQYAGSGDVRLEIQPMNFLDAQSAGTKYSTRSANLLACVAEQQPNKAYKVFKHLFEIQPHEGTAGLTNDQLVAAAKNAGAKDTTELKRCVRDVTYAGFLDKVTKQIMQTEVLGLAKGEALLSDPRTGELQDKKKPQVVRSTPTVIVNGKQWSQNRDGELEQYILKLLPQGDAAVTETSN